MKKRFGFCLGFFLAAASPLLALDASNLKIAPQAEQFTLENGLQVIVIPDHRAPVVTHMVWYRIGAADEVPGISGIAHFLEHLMFKGTAKNPSGKFSAWLATIGGQENAFTSYDYTAFYQQTEKKYLPRLMEFESDRMTGLILNDANVLPERDVIVEERRQNTDQRPEALLGEAMQAALYQNHHYGIPVIGWKHEMQKLTSKEALDFYAKYYTPNNAILIVAGDVTTNDVKKLAADTYGKVARRSEPGLRHRAEEPVSYAARFVSYSDTNVVQVAWGRNYLVPSYASDKKSDAPALELLAQILGGTTGRLYQKLVVEKGVAAGADADYDGQGLDSGRFSISATPKLSDNFNGVEAGIDEVLSELAQKGVTAEELERARTGLLASTIYAEDSQMSLARIFGAWLTTGSSFDDVQNWPKKISAVKLEDVNAAAKFWLARNRSVTGYLTHPSAKPAEPKKRNAEKMTTFRKIFFSLAIFLVVSPAYAATDVQIVKSKTGIEAWLVQEKSLPIIAVSFAFVGGASQDPAGKGGLTQFMSGLLDEGAGHYNARAFQEKLQTLAVSLSFSLDKDHIGGALKTLTPNRDQAFELLRLALNEPRFDDDAVERVRGQIYSVIRNQENNIDVQAAKAFSAAAFPNHPYGLPKIGTEESIKAITHGDILSQYKKLLARSNLKVAVVGDITADELSNMLDTVFGKLPEKDGLVPVPEIMIQNAGKQIVVEKSGPQTNIQFGQTAPKRLDPDFMAAYVMNQMLGGSTFSSRLYKEIREKRGLTYGIYTDVATFDHTAVLVGSMSTKNETAGESLKLIQEQIAQFMKEGPTAQELADTKSYLIGTYPLRFDTTGEISGMLLGLQLDGLKPSYMTEREGLINAVTIEDVKRVSQKIFKDPLLVTISGQPVGIKVN